MLAKRLLVSILLFGAAACGDDETVNPDGCTGHLCGSEVKITDPEGGSVIFEYIYFDTELQAALGVPATVNRTMAYFMNAHTPQSNPLPTAGACNNLVATKGWPMYVGSPRVDLDMGTLNITGKNTAGADTTIPIMKMPAGTDAIGRPHDTYYQQINPNAANFLKPNSAYTVAFGGAGNVPPTTLTDAIFLAADFTVTMPQLEGNGPMTAGTDFTVRWNPAVSTALPAGEEVLGITWLVDAAGSPTHMCPTLHSTGTFTIPGASLTEYKAIATARGLPSNKVILLRNAVVHRLSRLPNNEATVNDRRIDMLSLLCWAQLMDIN